MGIYEFDEPDERLEFTGERFTMDVGDQVRHEHLHRYLFALGYCVGRRVVDVACGEGYGAAFLGKFAAEVVGVDSSAEAIAHAGRAYGSSTVAFHVADATSIPVDDGHADVVVSFETIEHLSGQTAFLAEVVRVLRPDGLLILSTPDRTAFAGLERNPFHTRELDRDELAALLGRHFVWVAVGGQRSDAGSSIAFPAAVSTRKAASFFDQAGASAFRGANELPAPVYLIALATNGAPPEAGPSTLFDSSYLPRLHERLQELERFAPDNREELLATYAREQALAARLAGATQQVGVLTEELARLHDELTAFSAETDAVEVPAADGPGETARAVLFLSGCPGDAFRYRCEHQAAGLRLAGGTAETAEVGSIDLRKAADRHAAFVLHRVQWDKAIENLVDRARAAGKPVVFDSDDLVFDRDVLPFVAAIDGMGEAERDAFTSALDRCRRTLT